MKKLLKIGTLVLVFLLILFPVSRFYFWHDDFSTFYGPRTQQCIFDWPYLQFCPVFNLLLKTFGYNPSPYFMLGIVLAVFTALAFYFFMNQLFDEKTAFASTLIYSTFYIGVGVFQEAYDPIISFPALGLLLLSLIFIRRNKYLLGLGIFGLSVLSFSARAGTHFAPLFALIVLFVNKPWFKKILLLILTGLVFIFSFFITPSSLKGLPTSTNINLVNKTKLFLEASGAWILPEALGNWRTVIALGVYCVCLITLAKYRDKRLIFGLLWIFAMYLPYGLRSDFLLSPSHRYLVFVFPGILIVWATFSRFRFWIPVSAIVFVAYFVSSFSFLQNHLKISNLRRSFYEQLHSLIPTLSGREVLYFDAPNKFKNQMSDFFRVGYTSSESALGSEYGIRSDNLKIITEGEVLTRYKNQNPLMFYYDGSNLTKTDLSQYLFNKSISLRANFTDYQLPLIKNCEPCNYSQQDIVKAYQYIKFSRLLKKQVKIEASNTGEDTLIENAIDDDESTYWIGNRQMWVVDNNINLKLTFINLVNLQDIRFVTNSAGHKPIKIEFKPGQALKFEIKIVSTDGDDVPVINEIYFVPQGFEDVNFELVNKIVNSGLLLARNNEENQSLRDYLLSGTSACLKWEEGQKNIYILPDGLRHTHVVDLPAVRMSEFTIDCLESYPVIVSDYSN